MRAALRGEQADLHVREITDPTDPVRAATSGRRPVYGAFAGGRGIPAFTVLGEYGGQLVLDSQSTPEDVFGIALPLTSFSVCGGRSVRVRLVNPDDADDLLVIDGSVARNELGYLNAPYDSHEPTGRARGRDANSEMCYVYDGVSPIPHVLIATVKDVQPWGELLFDYGDAYWATLHGKEPASPMRIAVARSQRPAGSLPQQHRGGGASIEPREQRAAGEGSGAVGRAASGAAEGGEKGRDPMKVPAKRGWGAPAARPQEDPNARSGRFAAAAAASWDSSVQEVFGAGGESDIDSGGLTQRAPSHSQPARRLTAPAAAAVTQQPPRAVIVISSSSSEEDVLSISSYDEGINSAAAAAAMRRPVARQRREIETIEISSESDEPARPNKLQKAAAGAPMSSGQPH